MSEQETTKLNNDIKSLFDKTDLLAKENAANSQDVKHIGSSLDKFITHTDSMFAQQREHTDKMFSQLSAKIDVITSRDKTNWATLGTWATVIAVIGTMAMTPVYDHIKRLYDKTSMHNEDMMRRNFILKEDLKEYVNLKEDAILAKVEILATKVAFFDDKSGDRYRRVEAEKDLRFINDRLNRLENHANELGHPHLQTNLLNELQRRLDSIEYINNP